MAEDKRSHWQFLVNLLGAESKAPAPEETQASEIAEPTADAVPRSEPPRRAERKAPAKPSPPADWGNIASNLGLQVEQPVPQATSAADVPSADQIAEGPVAQAAPTADDPDTTGFPATLPGFGAKRAPSPPPSIATSSPKDDRPHPEVPEPSVAFVEDADADDPLSDTTEFDSEVGEVDDEEPRPRRRSRRRRRRRRSEHGQEGSAPAARDDSESDEEADESIEDVEPMEDVGFAEPLFTDDEDEQETDAPRRPRRRRRRRRSSASKGSEEAQHDSASDDRPTPAVRDERSRRSPRPSRPAAEIKPRDDADVELQREDDDDDVGTLEREAEEDHPRPRRQVTSWPEAIEQVIAANLAHRSKSNGQGRRGRRPRDGDRNRNRGKRSE